MYKNRAKAKVLSGLLVLALFFCLYGACFAMSRIPNLPPKITSVTPKDHSRFMTGDTLKISATAFDPNNDKLIYRFLIDKTVVKGWSAQNSFNINLEKKDFGRHRITIEVKDSKGSSDTKYVDIFVFMALPKPSS